MTNPTEGQFAQNVWKPKKWAHLPGADVPTVTLPDGTIAEAMASMGYAWDATDEDFVKLSVDHATGAQRVYVVNSSSGGSQTIQVAGFSAFSETVVVVPAVTAKRIKVFALFFTVGTNGTTAQFLDGDDDPAGGLGTFAQYGGVARHVNPPAFFMATTAGRELSLVATGTGAVSGDLAYWTDDAT